MQNSYLINDDKKKYPSRRTVLDNTSILQLATSWKISSASLSLSRCNYKNEVSQRKPPFFKKTSISLALVQFPPVTGFLLISFKV